MSTQNTHRVVFGWSNYQDFDNASDAMAFADTQAARVTNDPLQRRVDVLDLTVPGPYPVLRTSGRELAS